MRIISFSMRRAEELKRIQELELQKGIFDLDQSFHSEFKDNQWIIARNLSYQLSEGDIVTMFEQYGTIIAMELIRDKDTGMSRGTAIMAYEDPRSAILAVDNFNSVNLLGREINVDHFKEHKSAKLNTEDPRTKIPARISSETITLKPVFDSGSESETE